MPRFRLLNSHTTKIQLFSEKIQNLSKTEDVWRERLSAAIWEVSQLWHKTETKLSIWANWALLREFESSESKKLRKSFSQLFKKKQRERQARSKRSIQNLENLSLRACFMDRKSWTSAQKLRLYFFSKKKIQVKLPDTTFLLCWATKGSFKIFFFFL